MNKELSMSSYFFDLQTTYLMTDIHNVMLELIFVNLLNVLCEDYKTFKVKYMSWINVLISN